MYSDGNNYLSGMVSHLPFTFHEYSIVEFSQPEDAQKAITQLSDTDLKGRPVFIREVSIRSMRLITT